MRKIKATVILIIAAVTMISCSVINPFQTPIGAGRGNPELDGGGGYPEFWVMTTDSIGMGERINYQTAVYNNMMWVIGGQLGGGNHKSNAFYSADGKTWASINMNGWDTSLSSGDGFSLHELNGMFYAMSIGWGGAVLKSSNLVDWITVVNNKMGDTSFSEGLVVFNNAIYYIRPGNNTYSTIDGSNWIDQGMISGLNDWVEFNLFAHNSTLFIVGGRYEMDYYGFKDYIYSSADGVLWSGPGSGPFYSTMRSSRIIWHKNKWWLLGAYENGNNDGEKKGIYTSDNGSNWEVWNETAMEFYPERDKIHYLSFGGKIWMIGGEEDQGGGSDTPHEEVYYLDETL